MTRPRTSFEILSVTPADDMTTIRMAWRAKVRALHPDHATDKERAAAELAEVNAAFDALQGHKPVLWTRPQKGRQGGKGNVKQKKPIPPKRKSTSAPPKASRPKRQPASQPAPERARNRDFGKLYETALSGYLNARKNVRAA